MSPTVVTSTAPEPSIAELRAMLNDNSDAVARNTEAPAPTTEAPAAEPEAEKPTRQRDESGKFVKGEAETESEPGTEGQEPEETVEEKDPEPVGVQKRKAKEVAKQSQIDREIAQLVSVTKAKQAELQRLKDVAGEPGPEPVKTTEPAQEDGEPVEPVFGKDGQTWGDYQKELSEYRVKFKAWVKAEAYRQAQSAVQETRWKDSVESTIEKAKKDYGQEFESRRHSVVLDFNAPVGLQDEIGALDNWPSMVFHLGNPENSDEMASLVALYEKSPSAAVRELGRIEDRLAKPATQEPTTKAASTKPLPAPPVRVGGGAGAVPKVDFEKADMRTFKREIQSLLSR